MNQVGNIKDKIKIFQPEKLNIQNIPIGATALTVYIKIVIFL